MRDTTEQNLEARIRWLINIISHQTKPTNNQTSFLSDFRSFMNLEVPGCFVKKSYNTIKQQALNNRSLTTPNHYLTTWEYLKDLRLQAFAEITAKTRLQDTSVSVKELEKRALLEAHLCAMAYLESYDFLRSLLSDPSLSDFLRLKISNFLNVSVGKYSQITSHAPRESASLHLVKGGKT
ncbi:hypothetical protein SAMN04490202_0812 [Pseudomonas reinekei]|uniref:Uncharacterized protein n=1 Tax=Pseudomonas reinekei TaxID=395598 RepID=A0A1H0JDH5_PSERE|nr:hypothetical protein [Pseudomonas reinekei]KAB0483810.1 hypothetical protein F7R15_19340 [Pseudomonas reinekei]SDO41421.1 hypothetical protein SAMN04490202_0812 [Pseudomonas reinekei]